MSLTEATHEVEGLSAGSPGPTGSFAPKRSSRTQVKKVLRDLPAALSILYLVLILLMAIFAPLIVQVSGWGPLEYDKSAVDPNLGGMPIGELGGISTEHWFGVEPGSGRDIFARIVYGARVSMLIALSATLLSTVLGIVFGLLAGYFGGWIDTCISRFMEFLMAFPALIFMIAILSALPADNRQVLMVVVISFFGWPGLARIVRAQTLSLREREFVEAAKASGGKSIGIVFKEILPNLRSTIIVLTTLAVPGYVGTEAGLSFLGVGVVPPAPSWGQMIAQAVRWYAVDPMYFVIPSLFLFLLVLSSTVLGDRIKQIAEGDR